MLFLELPLFRGCSAVLFFFSLFSLRAQEVFIDPVMPFRPPIQLSEGERYFLPMASGGQIDPDSPYGNIDFPQWALDLRRFEVIFIGSLPVTFLFATLIDGLVNSGGGGVNFGEGANQDYLQLLLISSYASLGIAVTDFILGKVKIHRRAKEARAQGLPLPEVSEGNPDEGKPNEGD